MEHLGFLGPQLELTQLVARTTNFQRTARTLAGVITGLVQPQVGRGCGPRR